MTLPLKLQLLDTRLVCRIPTCTVHSRRCCYFDHLSFNLAAGSRRRPWPLNRGAVTSGDPKSPLKLHRRQCVEGIDRGASALEGGAPQVAMDGDTVVIHYICRDEDGNVVDDSTDSEDPVSFEVGAGEITGNPLFQAFDEAIRGLPLGSTTVLEAKGGDWKRELFFEVPRDHEEMQRLDGRYKNQGGLQDGLVVELLNGASAMVVAVTDDVVKIDANNMLAGKRRIFDVTLLSIEAAQR